MYPKVSVIIIAKNEPRIRYTLESLANQTVKPYEVLVVVNDANDISAEIAKVYINKLPIKIVLNETPGYGSARKTGVEQASGDIIVFIDADCIADKDWIKNLVEVFIKSDVLAQAGKVIDIDIESLDEISIALKQSDDESTKFLKFAPTMNFAFSRKLLSIIGNFDLEFSEGGEDLDFCIRLIKAGYRILYNPNAKVYHLKHGFSLRKAWRDGKSRARAFIKHGSVMLEDAITCLFHSISLLILAILLALGYYKLGLLLFIPSLLHRLYRVAINVRQGNGVFDSLLHAFITYISYISFLLHYLQHLLNLLIMKVKSIVIS